ncbi:MAG: DsrE family protein [Candidatus Nitrosotenuis sp.]
MNKQYSVQIIAAILLATITAIPTFQTANAATASSQNIYVIHIKSGDPEDHFQIHSAQMGVEHALAFKKAGKQVVVFLDVNGVKLIDNNRPNELKYHYNTLQSFLKMGGKIIACQHCLEMNEINSSLKGVTVDKHPTMPALQKALESAKVVLDY